MNIDLHALRNFAIILIFTVLFGTAALDKFKTLKTPEWFVKQFDHTLIAKLPGGAKAGYWMIALFELALTLAFIVSALSFSFLPLALTASLFLFGILCFGLRLANDYQGSANMFVYFAATLISLLVIS